jgi:hypothetical protein
LLLLGVDGSIRFLLPLGFRKGRTDQLVKSRSRQANHPSHFRHAHDGFRFNLDVHWALLGHKSNGFCTAFRQVVSAFGSQLSPSLVVLHQLFGKWSVVEGHCYGEVGLRLMNEMWKVVKDAKISTTGINHWVYMADERMFVGVEVVNAQRSTIPNQLEPFDFELRRHMKHRHIGPYQALPQKWKEWKAELIALGEIITFPSLEVYGHACADPSKAETTILMGLTPQAK